MNISKATGRALMWAVAGALACYILIADGPDLSPYREPIIVSHADLVRDEPDTVVRWRDRFVTVSAEPIVRERALGAATLEVARFCVPAMAQVTEDTSSTAAADTVLLIRSVTIDPGWFLRPDRVRAIGPTSHGDLYGSEYSMYSGTLRAHGDSLIVRTPRFGIVKPIIEGATWIALGWTLGKLK